MCYKKIVSLCLLGILISCGKIENPIVTGTFEGSGEGRYGLVSVLVTLEKSKITQIDITESSETETIAAPVYTDIKQTIINNNNINVDTISGATITSEAFLIAIDSALKLTKINLKGKRISIDLATVEEAIQNYDIVVIGAGGAGFSATIEAKNNGASNVIILEKISSIGGNTLISGGAFNASETWIQKKLNIKDNKELFYQDTLTGGDNLADPELVKYFADNASDSLEWLNKYIGVKFSDETLQHLGGHSMARAAIPTKNTGVEMITLMHKKSQELGITVKTGITAKELIMSNDRFGGIRS